MGRMEALAKLISVNNLDKMIFAIFLDHGMILTKLDIVDDKVGAALSMTYTIEQLILFVGTGQTYTNLKNM
ncbi:unnamed protein product [Rhizophagus irregularis]|uniref:SRP54-type proteins GTP-binding domain-containing protein n=1 Tax=Rhizophagus irregularis TaxID=588596 RepID=A0A915ZY28_9GLOM|nr:unnamed protein product [Rhizophagus irregularis]CAB5394748.1 unnamed protein product [Rhizophagus irregularis]